MPDKKYDAVIVGGGHHATIIACYLARAGLKTAMFERWHEMGGGACGEELPLPGYIQNPCAHFTRFYAHPAYADFNLREYGLVYTFPEYNEAWIYPNGNYILGKTILQGGRSDDREGRVLRCKCQITVEQVGKINKHDAGVVEDIIERYTNRWRAAFGKYRYTAPGEWGDKDPLEELFDDPKYGIDPKYATMTVGEIATDLFESPEVQTFYMRAMQTSNGLMPCDQPGLYYHIHALGLVFSMDAAAIVIGGTHSITHALLRAFESYGGEFFVLSEVEKVLVKNGAAKGIRLKNGTEIAADIVISDLSVELTLRGAGQGVCTPGDMGQSSETEGETPQTGRYRV